MLVDDDNDKRTFIAAFISAAKWQATDDEKPVDDKEWTPGAVMTMTEWCLAFIQDNAADIAEFTPENAGVCFALTANGHGAGFIDYNTSAAMRLRDKCKPYSYDVYVNDDGKLEVT